VKALLIAVLVATGLAVLASVAHGVSGTDTITTIAGNGTPAFNGDGSALQAALQRPGGVAVDSAGNVFVADCDNNRVREISNRTITTVVGTGEAGFSGDGGSALGAKLSCPVDVAFDGLGNLYISDERNHRVRKVEGGIITTVAGNGVAGYSGDNGQASLAALNQEGIDVDQQGNLYVADTRNHRVRTVSNGIISTAAGNGSEDASGDGGPATAAGIQSPWDVAVDSQGDYYVSDTHGWIRKVSGGTISNFAGTGFAGTDSGDGGPATSAGLSEPLGIALDRRGNLYVTEGSGNAIRKVDRAGIITTIAGTGVKGFSGDGGEAGSAQVDDPWYVAVDRDGNLYFTDHGNQRIREIKNRPPAAAFTTSPATGTAPLKVTFDASGSSDPGGKVDLFSWEFGDGTRATTGATTTHRYARAGTFKATLTVADDSGATATATRTITVAPAPKLTVSHFTVGKAAAGKPFTVSFTVKTAGKGVQGTLACSAKLDGRRLTASSRSFFAGGGASCTWNLPKSASGERIAGSISETFMGAKASRSYSVRVS
jgi:PKD repeat protein